MTQIPGTNSVIANFDGVVLETGGERFRLSREGNDFWVAIDDLEEWRKAPAGSKPPPVRVRMGLVTGSHHMQVFWLPAGFGNAQLGFPFTWLIADGRWAPRNEVFIRDPTADPAVETWNMTCIRCHATAGQPRPRREQELFDTRVADLGIACEACHGPGDEHVRRMRDSAAERREHPGLALPSELAITQPARLEHERASEICGQCHSIRWFDDSEPWVEEGFRYRPGDRLEETTPVVRPSKVHDQPWMRHILERAPDLFDAFFWSDGMIRVAGREFNGLLESPCYQRGNLTCLSCHSMHGYTDADDQLKSGMDGDRACVSCHEAGRYGPSHTHHAEGSSGSLCYNCHMPHTTYGLLKAIRQHQVDSPRVEGTLRTGRPNACNLCHLDRSLAWTGLRLSEWYGQPPADVPSGRQSVSAVVWDLLSGDAGQRALAAWHLGWQPARDLTGNDWQAPFLARLLKDPYAAVRYIAYHSLRELPGFADLTFDFAAPEVDRDAVATRVVAGGPAAAPGRDADRAGALLLNADGTLDQVAVEHLAARRNDRPMRLRE